MNIEYRIGESYPDSLVFERRINSLVPALTNKDLLRNALGFNNPDCYDGNSSSECEYIGGCLEKELHKRLKEIGFIK
jgi:hypothetical protein